MGRYIISGGSLSADFSTSDYPASGRGAMDQSKSHSDTLDSNGKLTFSVANANTKKVINVVPDEVTTSKFSWSRESFSDTDNIIVASDNGAADADIDVTVYYK
jgi:hypothetical protein